MCLGTAKGTSGVVQADDTLFFLVSFLGKVEGEAALCGSPTEHGLDSKDHARVLLLV